ncbi:hypothetical protein BGZ76_005946, partial [Entomortierella beljakovae]
MAYISSPITHLTSQDPSHMAIDNKDKRASECEFPAKAIKVESPYQSYLNHPFMQLGGNPTHANMKPYVSKYNSYTNSSKNIKLITIPSSATSTGKTGDDKFKHSLNDELSLNSPTSPLVSPPPPYLPSEHGENKFKYGFDVKKSPDQLQQHQFAQWPSMMKLSSTTGAVTANLARPKLARVLPPQAIPILTNGLANVPVEASYPSPVTPSSSRASRFIDGKEVEALQSYAPQHNTVNGTSATVNVMPVSQVDATCNMSYPDSFWEDARQSKMHWVLLPFGCVMLGTSVWVIISQVFLEWLVIVPVLSFLVFAIQFGVFMTLIRGDDTRRDLEEHKESKNFYSAGIIRE